MKIKILIAGILAVGVVFGHFAFGMKWYVKPMMNSNTETILQAKYGKNILSFSFNALPKISVYPHLNLCYFCFMNKSNSTLLLN